MKRLLTVILVMLILSGVAAGGYAWYASRSAAPPLALRTAPVARGPVVSTISATGTIEPEEVVDVGAQVAGRINEFGKDKAGKPIDYGTEIEEGTVLAVIDDVLYTSDVLNAEAQLAQANASVIRAEADLVQMQAKRQQADRDWARAQKLGPSEALAETSYDAYRAAYDVAGANVKVGEATIAQAKADVAQATAALQRSKRNLSYCTITSPVKGVIIDRRVNIGQTVVSSLGAPSLFLIAKDLKRLQIWVAVNEADIGHIRAGQPVTFTVDAFGGRTFRGAVRKVRLNATMTQNVVTYTVEVTTDNVDGKLLPYMTANVLFEVDRKDDVLCVPNAALRWSPQLEQIAPDARAAYEASMRATQGGDQKRGRSGAGASDRSKAGDATEPHKKREVRGRLWLRDGEFVRPVDVIVGLTDGSITEVRGDGLEEGDEVVIGEQRQDSGGAPAGVAGGGSPFTPQIIRGRQRGS